MQVVGFDRINRQQSDFSRLRIVALKNNRIVGLGKDDRNVGEWMPNVAELDLSDNLLGDWTRIVEIGRQLKKLRVLDVSGNKMRLLDDNSVLTEALASLKHLVVNDMSYDWRDVASVSTVLPKLEILHAQCNRIVRIDEVSEDDFKTLLELDLNDNPVEGWEQILRFSQLPRLIYLNVNNCRIKSIDFPDKEKKYFPALKMLQLSQNLLDNWESVGRLNLLPITEMRIRSNPILETENGETCRQLIIASVASLKVLNGTEIFKMERYGAEVDYLKKYGLEYLSLVKKNEDLEPFFSRLPRYREFLARFGAPEEYELAVLKTDIKSSLVEVVIDCPNVNDFKRVTKKLPPAMTVHKLRALLQRLVKAKGQELDISYTSKEDPTFEVKMDNDLRELSFYSIAKGDTILVKW